MLPSVLDFVRNCQTLGPLADLYTLLGENKVFKRKDLGEGKDQICVTPKWKPVEEIVGLVTSI